MRGPELPLTSPDLLVPSSEDRDAAGRVAGMLGVRLCSVAHLVAPTLGEYCTFAPHARYMRDPSALGLPPN